MSKTILVVAAHADDEAIGCGGTIARHVAEGDTVHLILMADGVKSRTGANDEDLARRNEAAKQAHAILGISSVTQMCFPDNRMDSLPLLDIVQPLEKTIQNIRPTLIYTHHRGDLNVDHQLTHQAVLTACRPIPGSHVSEILAFEVVSSTEWSGPANPLYVPNLFIDITDYWEMKRKALEAYAMEMRQPPHARSINNLETMARYRGNSVGLRMAESFMLVRGVR